MVGREDAHRLAQPVQGGDDLACVSLGPAREIEPGTVGGIGGEAPRPIAQHAARPPSCRGEKLIQYDIKLLSSSGGEGRPLAKVR
jgi:hypothetical protein